MAESRSGRFRADGLPGPGVSRKSIQAIAVGLKDAVGARAYLSEHGFGGASILLISLTGYSPVLAYLHSDNLPPSLVKFQVSSLVILSAVQGCYPAIGHRTARCFRFCMPTPAAIGNLESAPVPPLDRSHCRKRTSYAAATCFPPRLNPPLSQFFSS